MSASKLSLTQGGKIPKKDIFEKERKGSFISQQNSEQRELDEEEEKLA